MSNLPGNPYLSHGQETLALAYEQRTANLIAFMSHADSEQYEAIWRELKARLGLGENNA